MDLKARSQQFLDRPVPDEIGYVSDSIVELFIRNYANGGKFDDEFLELGQLSLLSLDDAASSHSTPEAREYFSECKSIVSEIFQELGVN